MMLSNKSNNSLDGESYINYIQIILYFTYFIVRCVEYGF